MGFSSVFRVLQEVFPQVDSRALRAVAIEHSKDADTAVEVVLSEVMPLLSKQSALPSSAKAVEASNTTAQTDNNLGTVILEESVNVSFFYEADGGKDGMCGEDGSKELIPLSKSRESSEVEAEMSVEPTTSVYKNVANDDHIQVGEEIILLGKCQESSPEVASSDLISHVQSATLESGSSASFNGHLHADTTDLNKSVDSQHNSDIHRKSQRERSSIAGNPLKIQNSAVQLPSSPSEKIVLNEVQSGLQILVARDTIITDVEKPEPLDLFLAASEEDMLSSALVADEDKCTVETVVSSPGLNSSVDLLEDNDENSRSNKDISEDGASVSGESHQEQSSMYNNSLEMKSLPDTPSMNLEKPELPDADELDSLEDENPIDIMVSRSGQICSIDLLEDIIVEEKNNKKIMRSAKDSVINLMRELEHKEKALEQAKEEAARGGLDILARVDDLKQMLQHAKEANDMHAGEVYGEKAILATEARELQSRLLSLSDERGKVLAILDEMRQTLELRLAAAEEETKTAEQERLEKEESAQKSLAYEERKMGKVVQTSKILKEEAMENSKLREFLMDRGRLVDTLQGEMSVILQDVKLMKENFDHGIPIGRSLSSSQSSCTLSSSNSSLKSMARDQAPDLATSPGKTKETNVESSINDHLYSGSMVSTDLSVPVDDDWELFDNRETWTEVIPDKP